MKILLYILAFSLLVIVGGGNIALAGPDALKGKDVHNSTSSRIFLEKAPDKCPVCGKSPVAVILYGKPIFSDGLKEKIAAHKVVIGGCVLSRDDPAWKCDFCKTVFYIKK